MRVLVRDPSVGDNITLVQSATTVEIYGKRKDVLCLGPAWQDRRGITMRDAQQS